jgi:hypothetical protein
LRLVVVNTQNLMHAERGLLRQLQKPRVILQRLLASPWLLLALLAIIFWTV